MYEVKKEWIEGYAMLPCFTIKALKGSLEADLTCNNFLQWIFQHIFAPWWNGTIYITKEYEE